MINIDNNKLEKVLLEAVKKQYAEIENHELYLVIENLDVDTEEFEDNDYTYTIEGRYGREYLSEGDSEREFYKRFSFLVNSTWSWDFIAGYFTRVMEADE